MITGINRVIGKFLPMIFVIVGVIIIIVAFTSLNQQNNFEPTTGVIKDIQEFEELDADGDRTYSYEVTVDYKVDGKAYTSVMNDYKNGFEVGKEIDILYDPDDPNVIVSKGKGHVIYLFAIGALAIVIGVITFLRGLAGR